MKKFLWLSAFLLCFAVSMFGQGARFNGVVTDQTGRPVAAATVYVCELTATGTPCSPHASIFSDVGLTTPMANPITTDNFGRYGFWISPGSYLQQLSGFGINTYTQPITVGGGGAGCTPAGSLNAVQTNTPEGTCYGSSDFLYDDTNDNLTAGDTPFALPVGTTNSVVIGDTNYIDQPTAYNYVFGQGNSVYGNTGSCMVIGIDVGEGCYWFENPTPGAFFGFSNAGLQVVPSDNGAPYANTSIVQSLNPYGTNLPQAAHLVCPAPQDSTAQACPTSPTNWIGISEDGLQTVYSGMALFVIDNTATLRDSVCTSASNAGEGHDSGGTTPCTGGTQVGWVMSVTSNGATTSEPMILIDGEKVAGGGSEPTAGTPACYAAPAALGGNDTNTGLFNTVPKADVMACYDALPSTGGTIYLAGPSLPACTATDPAGCGIWLMNGADPNYSSPPAGWRKEKPGVNIIGTAVGSASSFSLGGKVIVTAGSSSDPTKPGFWMTGSPTMLLQNVSITSCVPAHLGFNSANTVVSGNGIWNLNLINDYFSTTWTPGCGPTMEITGESYWDFISYTGLLGNSTESLDISTLARSSGVVTVTTSTPLPTSWSGTVPHIGIIGTSDKSFEGIFTITVTGASTFTYSQSLADASATKGHASSDQAQSLLLDATVSNGGAPSDIILQNDFLDYGGIRSFNTSTYPGQLFAQNLLQEAGPSNAVELVTCSPGSSYQQSTANNIQVADNGVPTTSYPIAAVKNDCGGSLSVTATTVDGPANIAGGSAPSSITESPALAGQSGIYNGTLFGDSNLARRGFGPVNSRFTNLASPPSAGTIGDKTLTAITGPDGVANGAVSVTSSISSDELTLYLGNLSVSAGDIFVCGAWVESLNPPGFLSTNSMPLNCYFPFTTEISSWTSSHGTPQEANGEWDWVWYALKVDSIQASPAYFEAFVNVGSSFGIGVYAPVVVQILAGTVPDNEAIEYAQTLQTFRHDATAGQVSLLPGEQFFADSIIAKVSISTAALTISGIAGTGCLQIASGVVSGTGAACGSAPGGTNIFDSFQFAANPPITSAGNYLQLTYDSTLTSTYTGSGTSGSPYIATLKLPATAVSAGSYTFGGFTVDANGRLTAAASSSMQTNDTPLASQTFFDVLDSSVDSIGLHLAWTNTTTGKIQGEITGTIAAGALPVTGSGTLGGVPDFAAGTHKVVKSVTASVWADVQLSDTDLKGTTAGAIAYVVSSAIAELSTTPYSAMVSGATNPAWATPTGNGQCLMSGPSSYATTTPSFQTCPGTISFPQTVAGTTHSGGIPYFSGATTLTSSAALTANQLVLGGGAGASPFSIGSLGTTTTVYHGNASGAGSFGSVVNGDLGAQAVSSSKMTTELTYYSCDMAFGNTNASAVLANGDLGPQKDMCLIPKAATVLEVDVSADAGTPSIIVGRNHSLTIANLLSGALASAASGGRACSNTGGTASVFWSGVTCSSTLQNTSLSNGDTIQAVSGTAGGTAKYMDVHIIYATVN